MSSRAVLSKSVSVCAALALSNAAPALAGPLDPPPGAVAPTGKTLDQVRPGRPINALPGSAAAAHIITEPGVYYLTADVHAAPGQHGILVHDDPAMPPGRTTIELGGFSIIGAPGAGAGNGIHCQSLHPLGGEIVIQGGRIRGFGGDGISMNHVSIHTRYSLANDAVEECLGNGITVNGSPDVGGSVTLSQCTVSRCGGDGVSITNMESAELRLVLVSGSGGHGSVVKWTGGGAGSAVFQNCQSRSCGGDGFQVRGGFRGAFTHCAAERNGGDGFLCSASPSSAVAAVHTFESCTASANTGNGISTRFQAGQVPTRAQLVSVSGTHTVGNGIDGMRFEDGRATVANSSSSGNSGNGITLAASTDDLEVRLRGLGILAVVSSNNGGDGVRTSGTHGLAEDVFFVQARTISNGGSGVWIDHVGSVTLDGCVSSGNGFNPDGTGGSGAVFTDCRTVCVTGSNFSGNNGDGLCVASSDPTQGGPLSIEGCEASANASSGFRAVKRMGGKIALCRSFSNAGGFGIWCDADSTRIVLDQNSCAGNAGGIRVDGLGNVIRRNTVGGGSAGFSVLMPGNTLGPIVDESTFAADSSGHSNIVH